jgi:hypothetical protein
VSKTSHEVDVAVFGRDPDGRETLLAIGEAKWNDIVGQGHLRRLEQVRTLLRARGHDEAERTRLLLFSGAGFTDELLRMSESDDSVQLVHLDRIYSGS